MNNEQLQNLLKQASEKLGTNPNDLKKSVQKGDFSKALEHLNPNDAEKVKKILSDKDAASKILSTSKAKDLLRNILGEK